MDQFYLDNAALYQNLVKRLKPAPPTARPAGKPTEVPSPDMVVSARIRPLLNEDLASGFPCALFLRANQPNVVDIHDLYNHPKGIPILKSFNYEVDRLFGPDATSQEIYDSQVRDLVSFSWDGGVGTLFAYGQTGSGKTTTISGLEKLVVDSLVDSGRPSSCKIYLSIIELAGNSSFDLLSSRKPISILEDSFGVTQLAGIEEHQLIQGEREAAENLIERAASFRRTAPTLKNDASSRSHSICRLRIQRGDDHGTGDGFLYLVDLAGSEAARDVATHGAERMRETREINISLSVLKDCIRGKAQADALAFSSGPKSKQKRPHIPFRQSALTKVLKHVFDPSASASKTKTVVIACVNPSLADVGPSKNTLRYAEMLRVSVPAAVAANNSSKKANSNPTMSVRPSSRDPNPAAASMPFHSRVRPGMVVSYNTTPSGEDLDASGAAGSAQFAVILSPTGTSSRGSTGEDADKNMPSFRGSGARYLCAQVVPAVISGAYEVNMWQQVVVDVRSMEKEVIMEYDIGTRYYYIVD
ncbi:P-loop containing nucleoside triphosphate hydrolase protein [Hypoxylon rubiginosum]|uniref:P-loop containing nucleoside triphosphate hydrolase protein n=1 Tax=Hypoxylon rubiginosum TaxID=110542 RepID=A0ACC0D714_9PEZI|nr:P-loop containing nucleoside triphosphate hydrolase protein [Hypoxylon rubiginosum]